MVELVRKLKGHDWQCSSVQFHPAGDMLVSGSWDRTVRIWDVQEGKELRCFDKSHTAPITCVRWHPNGVLVASTSSDNTTCLWDASTGKKVRTLKEHFGWVLHCSFAPDRTKLATASWDKTVRLWDPNTGELLSTLRGHTKGVWSCAFYPVGHTSALLATSGEDCTARLWDTRTRKVALTLAGGHADAVYSVAWSPDGTLVATGSSDRTVTIWDPKAGKILRMLKAHEDTVKDVSFTPVASRNGTNILASAGGYSAILWNPKSSYNNLLAELQQHEAGKEVETVAISQSGRLMASGGRDGIICVSSIPDFTPKEDKKPAKATTWRDSKGGDEWTKLAARVGGLASAQEKSKERALKSDRESDYNSSLERPATRKKPELEVEIAPLKNRWNPQARSSDDEPQEPRPKRTVDKDAKAKFLQSRGITKAKNDGWNDEAIPEEEVQETNGNGTHEPEPLEEEQEEEDDTEVVSPDEELPAQKFVQLRKAAPKSEEAHPMVETAMVQNPFSKVPQAAKPNRNSIQDVSSLLNNLREKTNVTAEPVKITPKPKPAPPPAPVDPMETLLAKPVLSTKVKVADIKPPTDDEMTSF
eukprot:m.22551 g.22551  ORF g.22551 m.22551 type:complete len:587 (+) comp12961_c0_seq1:44-1804(+)